MWVYALSSHSSQFTSHIILNIKKHDRCVALNNILSCCDIYYTIKTKQEIQRNPVMFFILSFKKSYFLQNYKQYTLINIIIPYIKHIRLLMIISTCFLVFHNLNSFIRVSAIIFASRSVLFLPKVIRIVPSQ